MDCKLTQPTYLNRLLSTLSEQQRRDFILQLEFLSKNEIAITRQRIERIYAVVSVTKYACEDDE